MQHKLDVTSEDIQATIDFLTSIRYDIKSTISANVSNNQFFKSSTFSVQDVFECNQICKKLMQGVEALKMIKTAALIKEGHAQPQKEVNPLSLNQTIYNNNR